MKLRNFKKAIHRDCYIHPPRILDCISVKDDGVFIYYTCHKLIGIVCMATNKLTFIIKKKNYGNN